MKEYTIIITPAAEKDLQEIFMYIYLRFGK